MPEAPLDHQAFFNRPHWTRRHFFELLGAGVGGAFLAQRYARAADVTSSGVTTKNTAQNVIFILLAGAPSHTDTFDLKMVAGVTPRELQSRNHQRHAVSHRPDAQTGQP